jgi:pilus assembly protein TadC
MILLLLIALGLIGLSVVLLLRVGGFADPRRRQALEHIQGYGFNAALGVPTQTGQAENQRFAALATAVGALYSKYARTDREREIRELLRSAGLYRLRVATFLGYRVLAAVGTALFLLWLLSAAGGGGAPILAVAVTFGALGWIAPMFILRRRAAQRLQQIDREVPELVDLLVTTVEAGVGFASALQITARRVQGPLG